MPPAAKQDPSPRTFHGDTVTDEYAWLTDKDNAETHRLSPGRERLHRGGHSPAGHAAGPDLRRDQGADAGERPVGPGPQGRLVALLPDGRGQAVPVSCRRARAARRNARVADRAAAKRRGRAHSLGQTPGRRNNCRECRSRRRAAPAAGAAPRRCHDRNRRPARDIAPAESRGHRAKRAGGSANARRLVEHWREMPVEQARCSSSERAPSIARGLPPCSRASTWPAVRKWPSSP